MTVPIHTEDELVAEVLREQAIEKGDVVEVEDDESDGEEELAITTKETLLWMGRIRRLLLSQGEVCVRTAGMLALAQDEIARQEFRDARQTTLDRWFGCHTSE